MPSTEYECQNCLTRFDVTSRLNDTPQIKCPKCGAESLKQYDVSDKRATGELQSWECDTTRESS